MRVTSELWVSALLRRVFSRGGFGAVARRGASEAGAIFLFIRRRDGTVRLYGPAPQTSYESGGPSERRFAELIDGEEEEMERRIEKESRFDPDLWLVELETTEAELEELVAVTTP